MLETLKGVNRIGGYRVVVMDELRGQHPEMFNESGAMDYKRFEAEIRPHNFIYVRHDVNSISFTLQKGSGEVWGCEVDTIIHAAKLILEGIQKELPCRENACAITKLDEAIHWLDARTNNRETIG